MQSEAPLVKSDNKNRHLNRKWRRYPTNLAMPMKESREDSSISSSKGKEATGFRNLTHIDLVNTCIRRHTKIDNEDRSAPHLEELITLDETSPYGIKEDDRSKLVALEVERLLAAVDNDEPLLFPRGSKIGTGTRTLLEDLSGVAEQITCNLYICRLDSQVMYMETYQKMFEEDEYLIARDILIQRLNPESPGKHPSRLESENSKTYLMLVDHITAVIARLCIRSVSSQSFQTRCIANLATLSMKLKILEPDPVQFAETSMFNGDEAAQRSELRYLTEQQGFIGRSRIKIEQDHKSEDKAKAAIYNLASRAAEETDGTRGRELYNLEMSSVRTGLLSLLSVLLQQIKGDSMRDAALFMGRDDNKPATRNFDTTSLVYGAGFSSNPTLVSQDREGEVGATAVAQSLVACYNAFGILVQTARAIKLAPCVEACKGPDWEFSWRMQTSDGASADSDKVNTSSAHVILSVMIPVLCCSAMVTKRISRMLYMETFTCGIGQVMFETKSSVKFEAMATLQTRNTSENAEFPVNSRITSLNTSALAKRKLAYDPRSTRPKSNKIDRVETDLVEKEYSHDIWRAYLHELGQLIQRNWIIDESAIIVPCDAYVLTVLAACLVLVAGGIAIGFTLGGHVKGVDPFNITLFCWIMAGFLAAISKNLKVKEWYWQDFLKGRCVCRSVTELASVTGVDPQHIIAYLLHNEDFTIINVRGPFNKAFLRTDPSGFAIDVKPTLRTLLLSGLIPVQVATVKGPMLVVMEPRKAHADWVCHYHSAGDHRDLVCRMPQTKLEAESDSNAQDMVMEEDCPQWLRVLGIYNHLDCNFR